MKFALNIFAFLIGVAAYAQPFVTTWKTDEEGVSGPNQITIPTDDLVNLYSIHWEEVGVPANNGNLSNQAGPVTITFPSAGTYRVEISGNFTHIYFYNDNNPSDALKLLTIEQWGSIVWQSMYGAFEGCANLTVPASDAPNLSNVTRMNSMFEGAFLFNTDIGNWDVSHVTQMFGLFQHAHAFNQDISAWDVSNVTYMRGMFFNAQSFNQDLSSWDVSSATDISAMFGSCPFNGDISGWNTSNVTTMEGMFFASAFNQDIGGWDVSNVTDMSGMFLQAHAFNQDLNSWNVSNVTNMSGMFNGATVFNGNISNWNTANVTNMGSMFSGATVFNGSIDNWNVGNVTTMAFMFSKATAFNRDIGGWDVGKVTNMQQMFLGTPFNQDISSWNVSNVTNMSGLFHEAKLFNQNIGNWNVSNVTDMSFTFYDAETFNQDIGSWDVSKVTNMSSMINNMLLFNQDISSWDVSLVTNMSSMFNEARAFNQDIGGWNVGNVTTMKYMFFEALSLDQNIGNWDVSKVTDMEGMLWRSGLSVDNYDLLLTGWAAQSVQTGVVFGAQELAYCNAAAARQSLITSHNWTISGDIQSCVIPPVLVPTINVIRKGQPLAAGASVNFPNTGVGISSNQVFRIKNVGQALLLISDVQVTGDSFTLVGAIPSQVNPADSASVEIRFEPTGLGQHTGTISIFSNDGEAPVYTLNISGEGDADIEVYNVVTVNKNGKHDFLNIRNIELFPDNRVTIYDRWGNLVFERRGYNNIEEIFEGTSDDNKALQDGTYFYVIDKNNGSANKTGFLLLRR